MSKCNISIVVPGDKASLLARAKEAIEKHGGKFEGDTNGGSFALHILIGKIAGDYTITGDTFELHVTHKPLVITCHRIQVEMEKYLHA